MRVCMCAHVFVTTPLVRVVESPLEKFLPHPLMGFAGREVDALGSCATAQLTQQSFKTEGFGGLRA